MLLLKCSFFVCPLNCFWDLHRRLE